MEEAQLTQVRGLAAHCQKVYFVLLTASLAFLLAFLSDFNAQEKEQLAEIREIEEAKEYWQVMRQSIEERHKQKLGDSTKFEVLGTINVDGREIDVLINCDLRQSWVPHHRKLYDKEKPNGHKGPLYSPGKSLNDFQEKFDFCTDLVAVYYTSNIKELLTVDKILIGDKWFDVNQTVKTQVLKTNKYTQDRNKGGSRDQCMVDIGYDIKGNLPFGQFPTESAIEANTSSFTLFGSGGKEPPLYRQVELAMHIEMSSTNIRHFSGDPGEREIVNEGGIKQISFKLPTMGEVERPFPLKVLGDSIEKKFIAGEKYKLRYPFVSSLSDAYKNLETADVKNLLNEKVKNSEDATITFIGLSIPINLLSIWGAVILACISLYFFIHVRNLKKVSKELKGNEELLVPWMPLFGDRLSKIVTFATIFLLPVSVAFFVFVYGDFKGHVLMNVVSIIGSVGIMVFTGLSVGTLFGWRIVQKLLV